MPSEVTSRRSAGVLLHPTSLPGPFGIGDLGPSAYAWVDTLVRARQTWWQILPLGPTGFGDSPYQCFSAFAGNSGLISLQELVKEGLLESRDIEAPTFSPERVEFESVMRFKKPLLARAWENFQGGRAAGLRPAFDRFVIEEADWLEDYVLFMALNDAHQGRSWQQWPEPARLHQPAFLKTAKAELAGPIGLHQFRQFLFFRQWQNLKGYANERGLKIIGDIPIFVSTDSADVWANPQFFALDRDRRPKVVAGVPPDYFSATGQLWGNPLYDWQALEKSGFAWWIARLNATLKTVDMIRLDHFRGFESYWEVPAGSADAIHGRWVQAPGAKLLETLRTALGGLPIIAEDLGIITPEVDALRRQFDLPGMCVLQFAFGDDWRNRYLPHNYEQNTVAYTGTHDNDTTAGWYRGTSEKDRDHVRRYLARDGSDVAWDFIRLAWSSVADYAITPLQDILNLGTEARMNFPGKPRGNWAWRCTQQKLQPGYLDRLADMTQLYGRARINVD
ncbi:MAG: 4-alpha-glucanotransferase [Planctomycetes bacterium]|nr:4-alpha-glucanotransferase [Planctomycetota bacterium]